MGGSKDQRSSATGSRVAVTNRRGDGGDGDLSAYRNVPGLAARLAKMAAARQAEEDRRRADEEDAKVKQAEQKFQEQKKNEEGQGARNQRPGRGTLSRGRAGFSGVSWKKKKKKKNSQPTSAHRLQPSGQAGRKSAVSSEISSLSVSTGSNQRQSSSHVRFMLDLSKTREFQDNTAHRYGPNQNVQQPGVSSTKSPRRPHTARSAAAAAAKTRHQLQQQPPRIRGGSQRQPSVRAAAAPNAVFDNSPSRRPNTAQGLVQVSSTNRSATSHQPASFVRSQSARSSNTSNQKRATDSKRVQVAGVRPGDNTAELFRSQYVQDSMQLLEATAVRAASIYNDDDASSAKEESAAKPFLQVQKKAKAMNMSDGDELPAPAVLVKEQLKKQHNLWKKIDGQWVFTVGEKDQERNNIGKLRGRRPQWAQIEEANEKHERIKDPLFAFDNPGLLLQPPTWAQIQSAEQQQRIARVACQNLLSYQAASARLLPVVSAVTVLLFESTFATHRTVLHQFLLWGVYGSAISEVGVAQSPKETRGLSPNLSPRLRQKECGSATTLLPHSPSQSLRSPRSATSPGSPRSYGTMDDEDDESQVLLLRPRHVVEGTTMHGVSPSRYSVYLQNLFRALRNPTRSLHDPVLGNVGHQATRQLLSAIVSRPKGHGQRRRTHRGKANHVINGKALEPFHVEGSAYCRAVTGLNQFASGLQRVLAENRTGRIKLEEFRAYRLVLVSFMSVSVRRAGLQRFFAIWKRFTKTSASRRRLDRFLQHSLTGPLPGAFEAWKRFAVVARRKRFEFQFHLLDQRIFKSRQQLRKSQERTQELREQLAVQEAIRSELMDLNDEQVLVEADTLQERRVLEGILRSLTLSMSYLHTLSMQLACPKNQPALLASALFESKRVGEQNRVRFDLEEPVCLSEVEGFAPSLWRTQHGDQLEALRSRAERHRKLHQSASPNQPIELGNLSESTSKSGSDTTVAAAVPLPGNLNSSRQAAASSGRPPLSRRTRSGVLKAGLGSRPDVTRSMKRAKSSKVRHHMRQPSEGDDYRTQTAISESARQYMALLHAPYLRGEREEAEATARATLPSTRPDLVMVRWTPVSAKLALEQNPACSCYGTDPFLLRPGRMLHLWAACLVQTAVASAADHARKRMATPSVDAEKLIVGHGGSSPDPTTTERGDANRKSIIDPSVAGSASSSGQAAISTANSWQQALADRQVGFLRLLLLAVRFRFSDELLRRVEDRQQALISPEDAPKEVVIDPEALILELEAEASQADKLEQDRDRSRSRKKRLSQTPKKPNGSPAHSPQHKSIKHRSPLSPTDTTLDHNNEEDGDHAIAGRTSPPLPHAPQISRSLRDSASFFRSKWHLSLQELIRQTLPPAADADNDTCADKDGAPQHVELVQFMPEVELHIHNELASFLATVFSATAPSAVGAWWRRLERFQLLHSRSRAKHRLRRQRDRERRRVERAARLKSEALEQSPHGLSTSDAVLDDHGQLKQFEQQLHFIVSDDSDLSDLDEEDDNPLVGTGVVGRYIAPDALRVNSLLDCKAKDQAVSTAAQSRSPAPNFERVKIRAGPGARVPSARSRINARTQDQGRARPAHGTSDVVLYLDDHIVKPKPEEQYLESRFAFVSELLSTTVSRFYVPWFCCDFFSQHHRPTHAQSMAFGLTAINAAAAAAAMNAAARRTATATSSGVPMDVTNDEEEPFEMSAKLAELHTFSQAAADAVAAQEEELDGLHQEMETEAFVLWSSDARSHNDVLEGGAEAAWKALPEAEKTKWQDKVEDLRPVLKSRLSQQTQKLRELQREARRRQRAEHEQVDKEEAEAEEAEAAAAVVVTVESLGLGLDSDTEGSVTEPNTPTRKSEKVLPPEKPGANVGQDQHLAKTVASTTRTLDSRNKAAKAAYAEKVALAEAASVDAARDRNPFLSSFLFRDLDVGTMRSLPIAGSQKVEEVGTAGMSSTDGLPEVSKILSARYLSGSNIKRLVEEAVKRWNQMMYKIGPVLLSAEDPQHTSLSPRSAVGLPALSTCYTRTLRAVFKIQFLRSQEDRHVKAVLDETEQATWQLHCLQVLGKPMPHADSMLSTRAPVTSKEPSSSAARYVNSSFVSELVGASYWSLGPADVAIALEAEYHNLCQEIVSLREHLEECFQAFCSRGNPANKAQIGSAFTMDTYEFNLFLQTFKLRDDSLKVNSKQNIPGQRRGLKVRDEDPTENLASLNGIRFQLSADAAAMVFNRHSKMRKSSTGANRISFANMRDSVAKTNHRQGPIKKAQPVPVQAMLQASDSLQEFACDQLHDHCRLSDHPKTHEKADKNREYSVHSLQQRSSQRSSSSDRTGNTSWDYEIHEHSLKLAEFIQAVVHIALHIEVGSTILLS